MFCKGLQPVIEKETKRRDLERMESFVSKILFSYTKRVDREFESSHRYVGV